MSSNQATGKVLDHSIFYSMREGFSIYDSILLPKWIISKIFPYRPFSTAVVQI